MGRGHPEVAHAPAISTTSAGIAWTCGIPDGELLDRDTMLEHVGRIVALAVELGVVDCNIEDAGNGRFLPPTKPSSDSRPPVPLRRHSVVGCGPTQEGPPFGGPSCVELV